MANITTPKTTFNLTGVPTEVENAPQKILFIGQRNGGSAVSGELVKNIANGAAEDALFGRRSMIATMIREFKRINTVSQVDAIALDDPASAAATGTIVFSGTSTVSGTYTAYVQSKKLHKYTLAVSVGDTAATLSAALAVLINADDTVLVTADGTTAPGTVTLTSTHAGTVGNIIGLQLVGTVSGLTTTLTAMTGGTLSPTLTGLFLPVGDIRYQTVVWPASYDKTVVTAFLDPRFNPTNAILDGVAISSETDTEANLISAVSTLNSESYTLLGNRNVNLSLYKGSFLFEYDPVIASEFAANRTLRLTQGVNIQSLLVNQGLTNSLGGPSRAATPYHNTPFANLPVGEVELGWTRTQQTNLNNAGVSFLGNNKANNGIISGDIVTTYLTDAAGNPDTTFKYLNYVDTASNIREFFFDNNQKEFAQTVLTDGTLVKGVRMANAASIAVFQEKLYRDLSGTDGNGVIYGLTQAGRDALNVFKDSLVVSVNLSTGAVSIGAIVPIVSQLREINGTLEIKFDINTI